MQLTIPLFAVPPENSFAMDDAFLAEIRFAPARFVPEGWAWCDGRELPIAQYAALFEVLGTTYGGDGQSTFALPNLMGRRPVQIDLHLINLKLASQTAEARGLVRSTPPPNYIQPCQETYFCIALHGMFPVKSNSH